MEGLRVGVPERPFFNATQADVETLQRAAISMLADAGAEIISIELEPLWALEAALTAAFVIAAAEPAAWHRAGSRPSATSTRPTFSATSMPSERCRPSPTSTRSVCPKA